jgi:hypothetical protein
MSSPDSTPFTISSQSRQSFSSDVEELPLSFSSAPEFSQDATQSLVGDDAPDADASLQQLLKTPNKRYVIWNLQTDRHWQHWWTTKVASNQDRDQFQHIIWSKAKRSHIWTTFHQGAEIRTGLPKAICRYCWKAYAHPELRRAGSSTSTLARHSQSRGCSGPKGAQAQLEVVRRTVTV